MSVKIFKFLESSEDVTYVFVLNDGTVASFSKGFSKAVKCDPTGKSFSSFIAGGSKLTVKQISELSRLSFKDRDEAFNSVRVYSQLFEDGVAVIGAGSGITFSTVLDEKAKLENQLTDTNRTLQKKVYELEKAYEEIKTLSGLLPICMHCKSIRDDSGYWNRIEAYIAQRSDVSFSHGICGDCMEKHYPDLMD